MLQNPLLRTLDPVMEQITALLGGGRQKVMLEEGIWEVPHFNFEHEIAVPVEMFPDLGDLSPYGVCDDVEQIKAQYGDFIRDPHRRFCISVCPVLKSEQEPRGGWRWHKWGPYIGDKSPQCEYLYDEGDEIEKVFCYHIYELI